MKPIQAKKTFGQNFLQDPNICRKITDFAQIREADTVIEIGPGTGQLTEAILQAGATVYGIEIDTDLIPILQQRFKTSSESFSERFHLIEADVLGLDWNQLFTTLQLGTDLSDETQRPRVKLLGNLPYNIATRILTRMTEEKLRFQSFTFMVQKEVAERILATPCSKDYGYLTLILEHQFSRHKGFDVLPGAFRPRPKVVSHVMQLRPLEEEREAVNYEFFLRLIQGAFRHRRKTLWNNLASMGLGGTRLDEAFTGLQIGRKARPEEISLETYLSLTRMLSFTP